MSNKPSIPAGTRDFGPNEMVRRNYIFDTIRSVFRKYGYQSIETPTMENLDTLTGKYGDEGDKLIFKVLNSGDFLEKADPAALEAKNSKKLTRSISEKALRYDLTVPFARYVVMHRNDIAFPFKRYQIQPVWRADRPQRGRYREFYQCDADVVGSDSLLLEAELVKIYDEALSKLGLSDFTIKINNRKILAGIAESVGAAERMMEMTIAIDKLDKIGWEGVEKELAQNGFATDDITRIRSVFSLKGSTEELLQQLSTLVTTAVTTKGIAELREALALVASTATINAKIELDLTLARGLNYYTGAIFEVKAGGVAMGSIGGGGRYDNLTGIFGLKDVSGVGISFGADRIYDVLEELKLFPVFSDLSTQVLFCHFDEAGRNAGFKMAAELRSSAINVEVYPDVSKIKKQLDYANKRAIKYAAIVGDEELKNGTCMLKDLESGEQKPLSTSELITMIRIPE